MVEGGALIGADGLWSTVRKTVAPDAHLHFSGHTAFRALLPLSGLPSPFSAPVVGLWLGPKAHLVHYPVRGGEALNVVAVIEGGGEAQGWNRAGDRNSLLSGFTHWCKESKSLLERVGSWRAWSLYRLSPLASWSQGPITLLGDAAHPVLPYLAQGAALAIEDAAAIAGALAAAAARPRFGLRPIRSFAPAARDPPSAHLAAFRLDLSLARSGAHCAKPRACKPQRGDGA